VRERRNSIAYATSAEFRRQIAETSRPMTIPRLRSATLADQSLEAITGDGAGSRLAESQS